VGVVSAPSGVKRWSLFAFFLHLPATCLHAAWLHSFLAHGHVSSVDLSYTLSLPLPVSGFFSSVMIKV
jgi:hypothetical protein